MSTNRCSKFLLAIVLLCSAFIFSACTYLSGGYNPQDLQYSNAPPQISEAPAPPAGQRGAMQFSAAPVQQSGAAVPAGQ